MVLFFPSHWKLYRTGVFILPFLIFYEKKEEKGDCDEEGLD